jgi:zinc transport system substrate-binding protein
MIRSRSAWMPVLAGMSLLFTSALTACGTRGAGAGGDSLRVVAAFYPLQYATQQVGGDRVQVTNLVKPGAEPHDLELQPKQVAELGDADLVVYLHGFQPAVDDAVEREAGRTSLDTATVEPLHDAPPGAEEGSATKGANAKDPHIWLDPIRLAAVADRIADRLAGLDSAHATDIRGRAAALRTKLEGLDQEYATGLAQCQRHEIVTSHAAFGYLAARYHLTQIPITGLSPEEEPTPQHLAQVADQARRFHTTTIFFEALVSPKVAQALAGEVGAKAEVLDPIEGIEPGSSADYLSVMRSNLTKLRAALGCT